MAEGLNRHFIQTVDSTYVITVYGFMYQSVPKANRCRQFKFIQLKGSMFEMLLPP